MTTAHIAPDGALRAALGALLTRGDHHTPNKPAHGHTGGRHQEGPMSEKPTAAKTAEALPGAIICYAQCESCQFGYCYDPPEAHGWAGPDDIQHAKATGQPKPTGTCACPCARAAAEATR